MKFSLLALLIERLSLSPIAQFNWNSNEGEAFTQDSASKTRSQVMKPLTSDEELSGNHWLCRTSSYWHWREKMLLTVISRCRRAVGVSHCFLKWTLCLQLKFFCILLPCHISSGFSMSPYINNLSTRRKTFPNFFFYQIQIETQLLWRARGSPRKKSNL